MLHSFVTGQMTSWSVIQPIPANHVNTQNNIRVANKCPEK